ncbi:TspO/MBR family protein [Flagellimonas halotolerans]|uniref:TspO/MBR family protein n=1 Tax=Flagellimonas halotolerans TaxID=3112164 RepID=A0ABU6INQ3_9FLAO|nr:MULTISPECIES: TspO/MBR family protein [unclassified Allomuricauda]MEC3964899.1 TspO/MBR family protein [Muricauda sp. SYSU M86414]MEC4264737.1 TspO/MBR family protein [Muricauda sp. SYSU M84420]
MKKRIVYITICVLICLAIGFLSSIATQSSVNDWYLSLNKPSFTPPNWLFAPVWTALYIMMGIAAGIVWSKGYHHIWVKTALYHFVFQLLLNALWSIVFFGLKNPLAGMVVILALLTVIILTIKWFKVISKPAALLMIPYVLWVAFAAALNYKIWELNP